MATPTTVEALLWEQSTNVVKYTGYTTGTDKVWARQYPPITDFMIHSRTLPGDPGSMGVSFDALSPEYDDDALRKAQPAFPPNKCSWRLETEEDCGD